MRARFLLAGLLALSSTPLVAATPHTPEDFLRPDQFTDIKLSPDGRHFAATAPHEGRTVLLMLDREQLRVVGSFSLRGQRTHVADFHWIANDRLVVSAAERLGMFDAPVPTGELFATNVDGSGQTILAGLRAGSSAPGSGQATRLQRRTDEAIHVSLIDRLPDNDREVLVSVWPMTSAEPFTRAERLDVRTGRRTTVARAPVRRAWFLTDLQGAVRFATGQGEDNFTRTYYRAGDREEWVLINDESADGRQVFPLGFSADGGTAYLRAEQRSGPDVIMAMDTASREMHEVLAGEKVSPDKILYSPTSGAVVGAVYVNGLPRLRYIDPESPDARLYQTLQASFPGSLVVVEGRTGESGLMLLAAHSDRAPVDYFLFDAQARRASHLASRRSWIDPERTARVEPFTLQARDGLELHGYLTLPVGLEPKGLPMVVMPHGGPFNIADLWGFDEEAQLLASQGWAVLQVNFRGSGNRGRSFVLAGYRQWGAAMQDDVTDATRWAIEQGIADAARICIHGSSYGGYAALMGAVREPDLYRCASGNVGVYDMAMMHRRGDIQQARSGRNFLNDALGRTDLAAISPTRHAALIKADVFLAAGEADERAPPDHTRAMERALREAGKPVEAHYYRGEGHTYEQEATRRDHATRLLAFLRRHLATTPEVAP